MNYNDLRDNIEVLTVEELKKLLVEFNNNVISEQRYESIKLIVYELEYRRLSKFIKDKTDLKIILNYNYDVIWKIDSKEIENSMKFLNNNQIQVNGVLRWIPIFLSMNTVYSIYNKLKNSGLSNEKIFEELVSDMSVNLDNQVNDEIDKYVSDKEFVLFLGEIVKLVNSKRKNTDTYKKMMDELIRENDYVLKHLK